MHAFSKINLFQLKSSTNSQLNEVIDKKEFIPYVYFHHDESTHMDRQMQGTVGYCWLSYDFSSVGK